MLTNIEKEHYVMYHGTLSKFFCYLCCMKNVSQGMTIKPRQLRDLSANDGFSHKNPLFNFHSQDRTFK